MGKKGEQKVVVFMDDKGNPLEAVVTFNPEFVVDTIDGELGADYAIMEIIPITTTQDILAYARDHGYQLESESEGIPAMVDVLITSKALGIINKKQARKLATLAEREGVKQIHAQKGGLGYEETAIVFRMDFLDGAPSVYGSIGKGGIASESFAPNTVVAN